MTSQTQRREGGMHVEERPSTEYWRVKEGIYVGQGVEREMRNLLDPGGLIKN